jgi:NAD(P) transhydrogenase subunit alpha
MLPLAQVVMTGPNLALLLTIFVLAIYLGVEIITKVPPTLHTPLMSGSNAISGITIVGALFLARPDSGFWPNALAFLAIVFATANVVGGYAVTHRMLKMFKKRDRAAP